MRVKGIRAPGQFLCRAAVFVFFFGLGCVVVTHDGRLGVGRAEGNSELRNLNLLRLAPHSSLRRGSPAFFRVSQSAPEGDATTRAPAIQTFDARPLTFEPNLGQTDSRVTFLSHGSGYALFLTNDEAMLELSQWSMVKPKTSEAKGRVQRRTHNGPRTSDKGPRTNDALLRMHLVNANPGARVVGVDELPAKSNYFIGNDPAQWHTNVPNYAKVRYEGIYPGVDLVFYGNQRQLEYDFVLAPGADPRRIALSVGTGLLPARRGRQPGVPLKIAANGDLVIETEGGEIRFHKPVVYQEQSTVDSSQLTVKAESALRAAGNPTPKIQNRKSLQGHYILAADGTVRFEIPGYDRSKRLTIDPALNYSTYLGGTANDVGTGIAVDTAGNAYIVGHTLSTNFPLVAPLPSQGVCHGCSSGYTAAFVTKFAGSGSVVYSTYLEGSTGDSAAAVAVDSLGDAYVVGTTSSTNFPVANAFQNACSSCLSGLSDAFVTELNPTGSGLVFSTYLGGSGADQGTGIAVDSNGSAYVTGFTFSNDFPTKNPIQPCGGSGGTGCTAIASNAFVTKFTPNGANLVYSTFLGGSGKDEGLAIAVDASGSAYVTGLTQSSNFPTFAGFSRTFGGNQNAFVTKFDSTGTFGQGSYSTYLGGTGFDQGNGIAVDSSGEAWVTGNTNSSNFPTQNPLIGSLPGTQAAFVTKLDNTGSILLFSTYLGGQGGTSSGAGIALDSAGNCYMTGLTTSSNFPTLNPTQSVYGGNQDAFVTTLNSTGSAPLFSTYLGGSGVDAASAIAVDSLSNAYVTGQTSSNSFPTTANAFQPTLGGGSDAFVTKFSGLQLPALSVSPTSLTFSGTPLGSSSAEQSLTVTNAGDAALTFTSITAASPFSVTTNTCGASLAPSATCTVGVTFTPTASGFVSGSVTFTDNSATSPQQLGLNGNGTAPSITLSASFLAFGNQGVSTTSAVQSLLLSNSGSAPLTIQSIAFSTGVSSDYAETDTCVGTVAAGSNCTINVTFTPTTSGARDGTLTLTDNVPNSPTQQVVLTGTGVIAFTLSTQNPSQTVNRGTDSVTFTLTAGSQFGFTPLINLSCLGAGALKCSFNPTSLTAPGSSTLTVSNLNTFTGTTANFAVQGASGNQNYEIGLQILIPDFGLAAAPPTATVNAGESATYTLTLVPFNNYSQSVNLTCVGAPASITCAINPSSVTLDGTDASTATITLTTTARASTGPRAGPQITVPPLPQALRPQWLLGLAAFVMSAVMAAARRRRARLGFAMTALVVLLWAACTVSTNVPTGTAAGNYGFEIQGASTNGTVKHAIVIGLTVN